MNKTTRGNSYARFYEVMALRWWERMINKITRKPIYVCKLRPINPEESHESE